MIRLKKIKSLKERVQLRKCGEVFHLLANGDDTDERDAVFSYLLSLLPAEEKDKAVYFYQKGRYEDIYYLTLDVLGESPADWDFVDESGHIDFSKRTVFHHMLVSVRRDDRRRRIPRGLDNLRLYRNFRTGCARASGRPRQEKKGEAGPFRLKNTRLNGVNNNGKRRKESSV